MLSCFLLPYSCSAAAVSAGPLNPQSPSCAALRALKPSSCSTAAYVGQQQREVTTSRGRRRRKPALTPASGDNASRPAKRCRQQQQQLEQYPTGTRRCQPAPRPQPTSEQLIAALVSRTQLPHATAGRVVAARSKTPSIPTQPDKLCDRVQCLQQLLGTVNAELALRRCPSIVAYSSANLAFNYNQWQLFFGMSDTPISTTTFASSTPSFSQTLQAARAQALQRKLAARPQLLSAHVEQLVANYYEIGHMLGCEDYHAFAYKAMDAGRLGPDALQDKLLRVLEVLNIGIQQQQQQQQLEQQQQQQQLLQQQQLRPDDQQDHGFHGPTTAVAAAPEQVEGPRLLTLSDVQAAARRDLSWLVLAADTLEQRLTGLQQELEVPMSTVGAMFLRNPSLLNKKPSTLAAKAAALRALPGLQPEQAAAAMAAMPSLLNLDPARLQDRWQRLQQAASTHPSWRAALDRMPASSIACLLVRGEGRYQRMQQAVDLGLQDKLPLSSVFNMPDSYFAARLEKVTHAATQPKPASRQA